jgi:23S rRNA A2030 N6-methylase RlmJ
MHKIDKKAANDGDRLKHALLLEILARVTSWPAVVYAETHAGAGIYLQGGQDADHSYIRDLHDCCP